MEIWNLAQSSSEMGVVSSIKMDRPSSKHVSRGAVEVLEMLVAGNTEVPQKTLQRGFQGATQVGNLKKRAEIFRLLLQIGVSGEVIDIQLVSAVRYGDEGKELVRLLLGYGASPDYSNGEAVEKAVRSAFLGSLELLLGIVPISEHTKGQQVR